MTNEKTPPIRRGFCLRIVRGKHAQADRCSPTMRLRIAPHPSDAARRSASSSLSPPLRGKGGKRRAQRDARRVRGSIQHLRYFFLEKPRKILPRPRCLRVRIFLRHSPRKKSEGAGALLQRNRIPSLPFLSERRAPRSAPARRLFAGGPCFRGREPCKPNRSRRLGHRGNLPWEQIKAPMRADFLRPAQSRVQPGEAAGLSCPRTVTSSVPVFRLRGETASAEPFPAQMTPHEHAPRRERVIGI